MRKEEYANNCGQIYYPAGMAQYSMQEWLNILPCMQEWLNIVRRNGSIHYHAGMAQYSMQEWLIQ